MKRFLMTFAAMLLVSVSAFAQSGTPLKGDVNEDGVVDVADITAIIAIMKNGGGTGEGTKYYWYVGQTDPSTMTSITPIVSDTSSPGWRLIGKTVGTYTMDNPLWDGGLNRITTGPTKATTYVALPNNVLKVRDGDGNDVTTSVYTTVGTTSINNVTYYIYSIGMNKIFNALIF